MLELVIPGKEYFNEADGTFVTTKDLTLKLEHSLLSISKWEMKWKKPFLGKDEKTGEEMMDYIRCMTITQGVDPEAYYALSSAQIGQIKEYMDDPSTATWFSNKEDKRGGKQVITSELVYSWMIALQIPFECEKWHLNRLFTLIRICDIRNSPPKKMSKAAVAKQHSALNASRRKKMGSKG